MVWEDTEQKGYRQVEVALPPVLFVDRYTWPYPQRTPDKTLPDENDDVLYSRVDDQVVVTVAPAAVDLERPLSRADTSPVAQRITLTLPPSYTDPIVHLITSQWRVT